jgi:hypothetical protein
MSDIKSEFDAAIATARHALEQFRAEPFVESKRGTQLSPWFRVWRDSSEVAQRWHRQLREEPEPSLDDEIDRLLGKGDPRG